MLSVRRDFSTVAHNCHGKIQFNTAEQNWSRQNTIRNNKFKLLPANYKHSRQKQIQLLQFKIHQDKSKTLTAIAKQSRQKQNAHGKLKSRIVVSGCLSTWCRVSPGLHIRQDVDSQSVVCTVVCNVDT